MQLSAAEVADLLKREKIISEKGISLVMMKNEIDGEALLLLETDVHLKEIGLKAVGDRMKLRAFISKHRTKSVTPAVQTDALYPFSHSEQLVSITLNLLQIIIMPCCLKVDTP